jgi:paraquat-inducible protein B
MALRNAAWRVGALALAGLVLIATAAVLAGGHWFASSERALLRFQSSVFGLQPGAPVVLRGVRIGQVRAVALEPLGTAVQPVVPVTVELDRERLGELLGGASAGGSAVATLVARGLVARLATQSLLTGQLYVELDVESGTAARTAATSSGLPEIPTRATRFQALEAQLASLDLTQMGRDLAEVAAAARQLAKSGDVQRTLAQLGRAAEGVQALASRLDRELGPLAVAARGTLGEARQTLGTVSREAARVGEGAAAAGRAADEVKALASSAQPLLADLRRGADELQRAAAALADAAGADSPLRRDAERALADVSRASRALRELSETLERHPDALLRGRGTAP